MNQIILCQTVWCHISKTEWHHAVLEISPYEKTHQFSCRTVVSANSPSSLGCCIRQQARIPGRRICLYVSQHKPLAHGEAGLCMRQDRKQCPQACLSQRNSSAASKTTHLLQKARQISVCIRTTHNVHKLVRLQKSLLQPSRHASQNCHFGGQKWHFQIRNWQFQLTVF